MDSRQQFEEWYVSHANAATGMNIDVESVKAKRGRGGDYPAYDYLHGCWIGWQAQR